MDQSPARPEWPASTYVGRRERMPWLGRARRKTRPSLEGAFGWFVKLSRERCGRVLRRGRCSCRLRRLAALCSSFRLDRRLSQLPFSEGCPGLGAPRRKRAPKPCGDIRLASRWVGLGSCHSLLILPSSGERPRLGWARRKTHPSRGGHSSNPGKKLSYSSPAVAGFGFSSQLFDVSTSTSVVSVDFSLAYVGAYKATCVPFAIVDA